MSDDPEIEKIKQRKLQEMLKKQNEPIPEKNLIDLTSENFRNVINSDKPTLVDFWAEWCGPCKLMHPVFERMSKKYPKIMFGRVNVDNNQNIAMALQVQSIPTFIMFKSGIPVERMIGAVGEPGIHMICKKYEIQ